MSKPDNGTIAAQLQHQSDQVERAREVIDRDPEEAHAVLEPNVTVKGAGGAVTVQDVFNLFVQLAQAQQTMQQQIVDLLSRDKQHERQSYQAHSAEDLKVAQEQQRKTLEGWKTEPRVPVFLEPDEDERRIYAVVGEFPPRLHRVNGLEYPIKVGEVIGVPESIAAQVTWAQMYSGKRRKPAQSIGQIADPQRGQFLAGSQMISAGHDGKTGEGPLYRSPVAATPDQAQPLDVRYDHEGR